MANVTIPNLTSATTITPSTDLMVLEQTNGTRKAKLSQIFTSSATSGSGLGITSGGVYAIKSGLDSDISDINTLLGNTSIASIGDGTVTGAVSQINSDLTYSPITGLPSTAQSSITIPLPANFKEMVLLVKVGGNTSWTLSSTIYGCTIPTSGSYTLREGESFYYGAGQTRYDVTANFAVSATSVTVDGSLSANNVTNTSTVLVAGWYR